MNDWPPSAEEVRDLPIDEIGIRMLRHLRGSKKTLRGLVANLRSQTDAQRMRNRWG